MGEYLDILPIQGRGEAVNPVLEPRQMRRREISHAAISKMRPVSRSRILGSTRSVCSSVARR